MQAIYLDHAATTPVDERVFKAMQPYFTQVYGNADSRHSFGRKSALAVLAARDDISRLIGGAGGNLYFTSSGSEANSWALKGVCLASDCKSKRIVLSAIEHPSLLKAAEDMAAFGYTTELVYPDSDGVVRPKSVEKALEGGAAFVGVMLVNNETGVIQPAAQIYEVCKRKGAFYFCDCVQAAGALRIKCDFADGISLSAHKFYGPKGVGALWLKKGAKIARLISGGQQESGLRGGTTNVAGIVGMGEALKLALEDLPQTEARVRAMRDEFAAIVTQGVEGAAVIGGGADRLYSTVNIMFAGRSGEEILIKLDMLGIAASSGSACSSGAAKPSYVITAMGFSQSQAASCVRFSFGRDNTQEEARRAAEIVVQTANSLKKI